MGVAFKPRLRDTFGNKFRNGVKPAFCDFVDVKRGKTIFSVFAGFVITRLVISKGKIDFVLDFFRRGKGTSNIIAISLAT